MIYRCSPRRQQQRQYMQRFNHPKYECDVLQWCLKRRSTMTSQTTLYNDVSNDALQRCFNIVLQWRFKCRFAMMSQTLFCKRRSTIKFLMTLYNDVHATSHTHTMAQSWDLKHKIIRIQPSSGGPFYSLAQIHFESVNIILSRKGHFKYSMIETTVIRCHPKM